MAYECRIQKKLLEEKYNSLCNRNITPIMIPTVIINYDPFKVSSIQREKEVQPDIFLKNKNWLELITSMFDPEHEIVVNTDIVVDEQVLK